MEGGWRTGRGTILPQRHRVHGVSEIELINPNSEVDLPFLPASATSIRV